jgi:hypothetical protein
MKFYGSRDMAHCAGVKCPIKKKCHRYIAHKTLDKDSSWQMVSYVAPHYDKKDKVCSLYWKEEK